jgi:hypothetical protein
MLNYTNDPEAICEMLLADLQEDTTTPFKLQYSKALEQLEFEDMLNFMQLVKSRFPENFTRLKDDSSLLMAA